ERDSRSRLDGAQQDLGRATAEAKEAARSAQLARERALAAEGSRRESEQRLARARERLAEIRGERGKLAVEEERAAGALRLLEEQVRAELGLPDDEPLPDPASIAVEDEGDEKERASTLAALQRLRRRLIALEPVNPLAATELAEIGERHGFLTTQKADLERALTATALLLAILRVRPAPFCVLDEVDAALDERNVGRFTQALRELTDRTQFVVITHNRGTIEAADMLYGVSMDDGGVSKVISLRLAEL